MINSTQPIQVFLIYAHKNRKIVYKLYQRLIKDGINVWLDAERLRPGQDWKHEIRKAILKSAVVIVCLSRDFDQQQGYRYEELKLALDKASVLSEDEVFIIPVRLEKCNTPESLQHLHRVDLFISGGYKRLLRVLQGEVVRGISPL